MQFQFISPESEHYPAEQMLRWEVLGKPLGLSPDAVKMVEDTTSLHLVALDQKKVVGCVCFLPETKTEGRIFQMAISDEYQGKKFARKLLITLEDALVKKGIVNVYVYASSTLKEFYHLLGYQADGETATTWGQPYHLMRKNIGDLV